jgi:hypothetical protein
MKSNNISTFNYEYFANPEYHHIKYKYLKILDDASTKTNLEVQ